VAVIEVEGCILRTMDYRDRDRIISVLTPSHGRLDMIARGARKSFKRFGGHLQLFTCAVLTLDYKETSTLHGLRSAVARESFQALQGDLTRFAVASYLGEVALRTASTGERDPASYRTFVALLERLVQVHPGGEEWLLRIGQAAMLDRRGVLADFERCTCGHPIVLSEVVWRTVPESALRCSTCAPQSGRVERIELPIARALQAVGRSVRGHDPGAAVTSAALRGAGRVLDESVAELVGAPLKSEAFLASMLTDVVSN